MTVTAQMDEVGLMVQHITADGFIRVKTRYLHGHTGVIQRTDFDGAVESLLQVLTRLDAGTTVDELTIPNAGHFEMVAPTSKAWPSVVTRSQDGWRI